MEKRQAVEFLEYLRQDRNLEKTIYGDALNIAIGALKAQLSQEGATSDLISRQAALDALDFEIVHITAYCDGKNEGNPLAQYNKGLEDGKKAIEALPPAQHERKRGKWLADNRRGGGFWVCSCCKFPSEAFAANVLYKFCPNCGAKMKGEPNERSD